MKSFKRVVDKQGFQSLGGRYVGTPPLSQLADATRVSIAWCGSGACSTEPPGRGALHDVRKLRSSFCFRSLLFSKKLAKCSQKKGGILFLVV